VKRIVFSSITKFIAVILFVVCMVMGTLIVSDGIIALHHEDDVIYEFESDFSQSWYISYLLDEPENVIFNAYHSQFYKYYDHSGHYAGPEDIQADNETVAENIQQRFDEFYYTDVVNYFVQWNDIVITNCGAKTAEELMQGDFYSYAARDESGMIERASGYEHKRYTAYLLETISEYDDSSNIIVCSSIKPEALQRYKTAWENQEKIVIGTIKNTAVYAVSALLLLIYLLCACGKNKDGEYTNMWIDNIWAEIHLAAVAGAGVGAAAVCVIVLDEYMSGHFPYNLIDPVIGAAAALGSLIIITSLLSIIRNIKTRRLVETSGILLIMRWVFRVLKWCLNIFWKAVKWIWRKNKSFWTVIFRMLSRKTGVIFISMLFVYTALIGILGIGTVVSPIWLIFGILLFCFACFIVAYRAKDLDEIKKGVREVRNGNVAYKIPELKCEDMKALASSINDIAKGLDESVGAKVKAERLKTELITNVSHDLKTPITSIINYTELLSKIEDLPEEARDYVSVIAKKSDRLKKLTQDLFDISKVQSGNEEVVLEKLDAALLINQSLAEYENDIQNSGLPFCVDATKELYIAADGRKMSRVVSNLISNILKYAMKNTRVFITAAEKNGNIVLEFKNISAYPLDFDVEEITGRFVRGDESRTAEGNGLGLAIAKSYTEICNGTFEIAVDGDLFKAILKFRKYVD